MKVLVTGATGFVGSRLVGELDGPVVLSRSLDKAKETLEKGETHAWPSPTEAPPPGEAFEGVEAVIHLAGEPIAGGRWNEARKRRILDSRVLGTRQLVAALRELENRPKVLVSSSAVGYYGDRGDEPLAEDAAPGDDFLAEVCKGWEEEALRARELGMRVVCLRTGVVLGADGGALAKMLTPFKLCLGGRLGSGRQWMPWIHVDDLVGLILHAVHREDVSGPLNGTAPNPVTNREFTKALARVLHRPAFFAQPAFVLRLLFGEMATILLSSQRTVPRVATETGYSYLYPQLESALRAALQRQE